MGEADVCLLLGSGLLSPLANISQIRWASQRLQLSLSDFVKPCVSNHAGVVFAVLDPEREEVSKAGHIPRSSLVVLVKVDSCAQGCEEVGGRLMSSCLTVCQRAHHILNCLTLEVWSVVIFAADFDYEAGQVKFVFDQLLVGEIPVRV